MSEEEVKEEVTTPTEEDYKKALKECEVELQRYQQILTNKNMEILRLATIIARQEGAING